MSARKLTKAQERALLDIAEECRFSAAGVSEETRSAAHGRAIRSLVDKGLVIRLNGTWLVLTDAGREASAAAEARS